MHPESLHSRGGREPDSVIHPLRLPLLVDRSHLLLSLLVASTLVSHGCAALRVAKCLLCQGGGSSLQVPAHEVARLPAPGRLLAGVGEADITPPPGFPTGGDGPAGALAHGYWTRLKARAFLFADPDGHRLVLVSCDLFAIPAGLVAEVARNVGELGLAPEEILVAATHTHQGPGGYLTSKAHNQFGAAYPGFDRDLFRFLASRIVTAIRAADTNARNGRHATLRIYQGKVGSSLVRNRAPHVFVLNPDRHEMTKVLGDGVSDDDCHPICPDPDVDCEPRNLWSLPDCPRLRAADRRLTLLEIRHGPQGADKRTGLLVFFAAHPTVLLPNAPIYSADFAGFAMATMERAEPGVLMGFFNGAEGDITTRRRRRDIANVRSVGLEFASEVARLLREGSALGLEGRVRVRSDEGDPSVSCNGERGSVQLPARPLMGVAALGGAEDDRTILHQLGWQEGVRGETKDGHLPKQPALDSPLLRCFQVTDLLVKPGDFPSRLPTTYATIGRFAIAAIPVEATTAVGHRIAQTLGRTERDPLVILGLANEYASYTASSAEYDAQEYIGASTIWGRDQAAFLECKLALLKKGLDTDSTGGAPKGGLVAARTFRPGPAPADPFGPFGPDFCAVRDKPDRELGGLLVKDGLPERHLPYFTWDERIATREADFDRTSLRRVTIERDNLVVATDDLDILTILLDPHVSTAGIAYRRWAALWLTPLWDSPTGLHRFHVAAGDGSSHSSEAFDTRAILARAPAASGEDAQQRSPGLAIDRQE